MGVSIDERGQLNENENENVEGLHFEKGAVVKPIPKGYLAVLVGVGDEEQQQRFVIPVIYVNHPLFMKLLKEAEEEYGFHQKGPIIIPCHVDHFLSVQCMIDEEIKSVHNHQSNNNHLPVWCFRD